MHVTKTLVADDDSSDGMFIKSGLPGEDEFRGMQLGAWGYKRIRDSAKRAHERLSAISYGDMKLALEPQSTSPGPSDLVKYPLGANGWSGGDLSSRVARDITEESLKEDLAELRRSLEALRNRATFSVSGLRFGA